MLSLPSSVRIYFFEPAVDMRKGFDGLAALVRASGLDVFSGHLFVFVSRRSDRVKVLSWERGGFVLWYKRLERGRFRRPILEPGCERVELEPDQFVLLLEGIDFSRLRRPRRWEPKRDRQPEPRVI
jgi:transposase